VSTTNVSSTARRVRLSLTLPQPVVAELRELVPARQRSQFVAEAIAQRIAILRLQSALEEAKGSWRDEYHPEFSTGVDKWLSEMRGRDVVRLSTASLTRSDL